MATAHRLTEDLFVDGSIMRGDGASGSESECGVWWWSGVRVCGVEWSGVEWSGVKCSGVEWSESVWSGVE